MEAPVETAAPAGREDGMVGELRGVPKVALQAVFGKALGQRIWDDARRLSESGTALQATSEGDGSRGSIGSMVTDVEIVGGMIEHVRRRAGGALRESGRQAWAIGLAFVYADGASTLGSMRLARPTNDGWELAEGAMELFRRGQAHALVVERVELKVTSIAAEPLRERAGSFEHGMVGAACARA